MTPHRVVVLGAARSGTKLLRDLIAEAADVGSVPFDVNFVWRHGNPRLPHDRLEPDAHLSERQARYIRSAIDRYAAGSPPAVVEKTVSNTLRLPYVAAVLPSARYVHVVRDGVDVVESSMRQWAQPTPGRYLLQKVRHFPPRLIPTYGLDYARRQVRQRLRGERAESWGVRYPGMDADVAREPLDVVCARQWRASVETVMADQRELDVDLVEVRYESLVADPERTLVELLAAVGLPASEERVRAAVTRVSTLRVGSGADELGADSLHRLDEEIGDLCTRLGYALPSRRLRSGTA